MQIYLYIYIYVIYIYIFLIKGAIIVSPCRLAIGPYTVAI